MTFLHTLSDCNYELPIYRWEQRGRAVRPLNLESGGPVFKSRPDR